MSDGMVERKDKMKYVELDSIVIEARAREDLGNIDELVESIKAKGVIQPVTVDENMRLLAGGRRCAAAKQAGMKKIPAIIRPHVDAIDSSEIELIENIHRKDFTWSERAKLVKKIDDLYNANNSNWSGRKTAELLDKSVGSVAQDLKLATYLEAVPELAKVDTAHEALKTVKKMEEAALTAELRKRQQHNMTKLEETDPTLKGIKGALHLADQSYRIGDCFMGMADMRTGGHINFIECDPPYGIDLNNVKAGKDSVGSTVNGYEEVPADKYPALLERLTKELYRVAYKDAWLVFWYGPTWHNEVLSALRAAGWHVDDIPAIWTKFSGQTNQPEIYLARAYEPFFVCRKGQPVLNKRGRLNVFNFSGCPTMGPEAKYHPTQRPIIMLEEILDTFTIPGNVVFVPFLGSGATLRAAFNKGLRAHGFDLNGKYKDKFMLGVEADSRRILNNS